MTTWYCKEQASAHIVLQGKTTKLCCLRHIAREAMTGVLFYTSYCKKRQRRAYFLRHITKGNHAITCKSMFIIAKTRQHNICWCCGSSRIAREQQQWFNHRKTWGCKKQNFHDGHQRMTAISAVDREITATSVHWYVVLQEAMTTKVDCNEGCEIALRNNQQNIFHRIMRTQAISRHSIVRTTTMVVFFTSHRNERAMTTTFFRSITRKQAN